VMKFFLDFLLSQLGDKLRKRVFLHKTVADLTNSVDKNILPAEYGGMIPMRDMIVQLKTKLEEKRDLLLSYDQVAVKLELYPKSIQENTVRSLRKSINELLESSSMKQETYGLQGSFRKLEID